MQRLWLIFAQTATVALALLFVVSTLKPEWLPQRQAVVALQEAPSSDETGRAPIGSYRDAARAALPSVVHIYTTQAVRQPRHPLFDDPIFRHFFGERPEGQPRQNSGLGSGVIVSPNGYILTNYHVIEGADDIQVSLNDSKTYKAKVVGSDPESDLAILQIKAEKLPAITFGQMDSLRVGDVVLAIGNPFGVGQTVTMGIVSALGRSHLGINTFENFIQTDAAINPGNSGGALVDINGHLLGINTAIYSRSGGSMGIGFAIPVSTARMVLEGIVRDGRVTRGWIGVEAGELSPELAQTFGVGDGSGVLLTGILQAGPAAQAGMQPGDVVTQVDGKPVRNVAELMSSVAALRPGQSYPVDVLRSGKPLQVQVMPVPRPKPRQNNSLPRR